MATPRAFISSTCYDLSEVRDGLVGFFASLGFDAVLSERGDIFYHPDLHTHEACTHEVGACHILILIIGGRFGGEYIVDRTKSITNAEYTAARQKNIPVFTFVTQDVLNDHNVWQRNKDKAITYPSIDKQAHAIDIFEFIDTVRKSGINNGFFPFRYGQELQSLLRKQLAGMFFDFLSKRSLAKKAEATADAVNALAVVSNKIEELVKSMYRSVTPATAEQQIELIDNEAAGEFFFVEVARIAGDRDLVLRSQITEIANANPEDWRQALLAGSLFQTGFDAKRYETVNGLVPKGGENFLTYLGVKAIADADGTVFDQDERTTEKLRRLWTVFRNLPIATRRAILERYSWASANKSTK